MTYRCIGRRVQLGKVVGISDPLVIRVAKLCEGIREALYVASTVIEEEEAHRDAAPGVIGTTLSDLNPDRTTQSYALRVIAIWLLNKRSS